MHATVLARTRVSLYDGSTSTTSKESQMSKISSIVIAAFLAVSSTAFATTGEVDPAHDGKHDKWISPGNGPGNGYGHFKGHDNNGNSGGNNGGGNGGSGGNGGNGGQGGQGGAGGNANQLQGQGQAQSQSQNATGIGTGISSSSLNANLSSKSDASSTSLSSARSGDSTSGAIAGGGDARATGGNASAAGGTSSASNGNVGNGNGAAVSVNNVDQSQSRYVAFMDAPALPATFGTAGLQARKVTECGPRYVIRPFERDADVPFLALPFLSINRSVEIQSEHGQLLGFDAAKPFELVEFPVPGSKTNFRVVMGHVLYMTTGHDSRGGAATGGVNYAGSNAVGVAGGSSANNAYGVIGYVAVPCVFNPETPATPAPVIVVPSGKGNTAPTTLVK